MPYDNTITVTMKYNKKSGKVKTYDTHNKNKVIIPVTPISPNLAGHRLRIVVFTDSRKSKLYID
jgi:hypothetical protein